MTHPLETTVSAVLAGIAVPDRKPYLYWEAAFVDRWGMIPDANFPSLALIFLDTHGKNPEQITCLEALRAFHVNQFEPTSFEQFTRFVEDYEKVPSEIVEPLWENDPVSGERLQKQVDMFDPNSDRNTGRQRFDMGRGKQPR